MAYRYSKSKTNKNGSTDVENLGFLFVIGIGSGDTNIYDDKFLRKFSSSTRPVSLRKNISAYAENLGILDARGICIADGNMGINFFFWNYLQAIS